MVGSEAERGANKAFEGHDTQPESKSDEGYVYKRNRVERSDDASTNEAAEKVGESISAQGNEFALGAQEPGRDEAAVEERAAGRTSAPSTGRFSSGVNPSEPIDPDSPNIPAP